MSRCPNCGVRVRGDQTRCPLCDCYLDGEPGESVYPKLPSVFRQFELFFRLLLLSSVAAVVICAAVNLVMPDTGIWSLFVLMGVVCFWIVLALALRKMHNIPQSITSEAALIALLMVCWDYFTGWRGWSIDYALPITCTTVMIAIGVLAQVLHLPVEDYVFCFMVDALFSVAPLTLYLLGAISQPLPSLICITLSLISIAGIIIFQGRSIRLEIIKRFHM